MKAVACENEGVIFEFDNLAQPTNTIGVMEPVRIFVPNEKVLQFQKDSSIIARMGREAAQRFKALMNSEK